VNRGERGIRLITARHGGRVGREHVTSVFDLLQREGEPQAVRVKRTGYGGKPKPESWRALASLALPDGTDAAAAEWIGWFAGAHDGAEMAAALALARRVARGLVGADRGGLAGAVEAESVSFLIALRLGLDTSGFVFPRVGSWAGADPRAPVAAVVAAAGERILAAAGRAFERIDPHLASGSKMVTRQPSPRTPQSSAWYSLPCIRRPTRWLAWPSPIWPPSPPSAGSSTAISPVVPISTPTR